MLILFSLTSVLDDCRILCQQEHSPFCKTLSHVDSSSCLTMTHSQVLTDYYHTTDVSIDIDRTTDSSAPDHPNSLPARGFQIKRYMSGAWYVSI